MTENSNDLWDQANNPKEMVYQYWGELSLRPWECALVGGVGKVPYEQGNSDHKRSILAMEMSVIPIPESATTYALEREPVEFSLEYKKFLKSVWDAGIDHVIRANGRFVRASGQPSGETYTSKKDNQIKNKTYIHIEEFFDNEEACRENYFEIMGKPDDSGTGDVSDIPSPPGFGDPPEAQNPDLEAMKTFLTLAVMEALGKSDGTTNYSEVVDLFKERKFLPLAQIYGGPEAKSFVEGVIAEANNL